MTRALSTHLFSQHRLTTSQLDKIWRAGIPLVELYCARHHVDYRDPAQVSELAHWFRDSELKLHSLLAPSYSDDSGGRAGPASHVNIAELSRNRRIQNVDEVKRALEIAEIIPFRYFVQHIGMPGEEFDLRKIDSIFNSLEEITVFAKHRGVEVLVENIPNELSNAEKLNLFFDMTHMHVNVCFDVGHAHLTGSIEDQLRALKPRIRLAHLHDNNGKEDQHLFPGSGGFPNNGGTVDWRAAMPLLASLGCPLLLEVRENPEIGHPLDEANRTFERLEGMERTQ